MTTSTAVPGVVALPRSSLSSRATWQNERLQIQRHRSLHGGPLHWSPLPVPLSRRIAASRALQRPSRRTSRADSWREPTAEIESEEAARMTDSRVRLLSAAVGFALVPADSPQTE